MEALSFPGDLGTGPRVPWTGTGPWDLGTGPGDPGTVPGVTGTGSGSPKPTLASRKAAGYLVGAVLSGYCFELAGVEPSL
jgi:hypothetical protein